MEGVLARAVDVAGGGIESSTAFERMLPPPVERREGAVSSALTTPTMQTSSLAATDDGGGVFSAFGTTDAALPAGPEAKTAKTEGAWLPSRRGLMDDPSGAGVLAGRGEGRVDAARTGPVAVNARARRSLRLPSVFRVEGESVRSMTDAARTCASGRRSTSVHPQAK